MRRTSRFVKCCAGHPCRQIGRKRTVSRQSLYMEGLGGREQPGWGIGAGLRTKWACSRARARGGVPRMACCRPAARHAVSARAPCPSNKGRTRFVGVSGFDAGQLADILDLASTGIAADASTLMGEQHAVCAARPGSCLGGQRHCAVLWPLSYPSPGVTHFVGVWVSIGAGSVRPTHGWGTVRRTYLHPFTSLS